MFKTENRLILMLMSLLLALSMAGCSIDGDDDDDGDLEGDERISVPRDRVDRDDDDLGRNEQAKRDAGIPIDADLVARGENRDLSYVASEDGMIYVQDLDDNERLVYSGRLYRNEDFRIDGNTGRFTINGRTVENLTAGHKFRVYFDRQ